MHGKLNFDSHNTDIFNLNLQSLITQLKNIKKVEFAKTSKANNSYIDIIRCIIDQAITDSHDPENEEITALLPIAIKTIKKLADSSEGVKELKRLETTDLDIAFIEGDFESVKNLTSNNIETKVYNLANKLRFMNFAMNQDNFKYNLTLKINEKDIPLHSLFSNIFTEITSIDKNNLAFIIQDDGGETWNYNSCNYEYNNLRPLFDQLITYGTGSKYLFSDQISETLQKEVKNIRDQKLDFVFVMIHSHDSKEEGKLQKVISEFPDDLAKETVYLIKSCYSGQYHKAWEESSKNAILFTTASENESSLVTSFNCEKFSEFFANQQVDTKTLVEFLSNYDGSTPHISGNYKGEFIQYMPVKDFHEQLISNNLEAPILETNINDDIMGLGETIFDHVELYS